MPDIDAHERSHATRQIAILLRSLPARTHRVLVGQLGQDDKQAIHAQLDTLDDVDPLEQYRVMKLLREELQAGTHDAESVESEIQDEIQIGRARVSRKRRTGNYLPSDTSATANEDSTSTTPRNSDSAGAGSIAASAGPSNTSSASNGTASSNSEAQAANSDDPIYEVSSFRFSDFYQSQAVGVMPASGLFGRPPNDRPARPGQSSHHNRKTTANPPTIRRGDSIRPPSSCVSGEEIIRQIDQFLQSLSADELCRALAKVTTRQAFLVLCGLPNEKAEEVLGLLPRRKAKKVRSDMRRMGPLQLSDIDAAKRVLAEIAIEQQSDPLSVAA
ncbi:FliG C-terminal domain-containing protein [Roseiconus lacunae]|uniref:FliG C-terminal domain-containing protein n=1 Tax=Roseiconus lacunae TaxID=2605694 RepID=UPI0011F15E60|nr:FliG C-terminal domain-containing protein [Roseiconus lacunae]